MAKATSNPGTVVRISLSKARALLGKHDLDHDGWVKLVHGLAAGDVPYWPDNPDLGELWGKLSGAGNPDVTFPRVEGDWAEFYIKGVRRTIGPIQVGYEAVVALLPKAARVPQPESQEEPGRISSQIWITTEAKRLKRADEIPADISKTEFAKLLADNLTKAAKTNPSIHPIGMESIRNRLKDWRSWPIPAIE